MKTYSGIEFQRLMEERGASELMECILYNIKHPTLDEIMAARSRSEGLIRRHFMRARYLDSSEILCVRIDILYKNPDGTPDILEVTEYDSESQFILYRDMIASEYPGTPQTN